MSDWVEVLRCQNRAEAEVAKSALDSSGIKALIKSDDLGGMRPHLSVSLGGVRLLVLEEDVSDARNILTVANEPTK